MICGTPTPSISDALLPSVLPCYLCVRFQVAALPLSAADAFLLKQAENKGELRLALTGEQRGVGAAAVTKTDSEVKGVLRSVLPIVVVPSKWCAS